MKQRPPINAEDALRYGAVSMRRLARALADSPQCADDLAEESRVHTPPEPALLPDELLKRLETRQLLTTLVLELPVPVRLVLFLRFYEGLASAEICARLKIPAGTVRWRLQCGLDELRERLDASFDGQRAQWLRLVLPLVPGGAYSESEK